MKPFLRKSITLIAFLLVLVLVFAACGRDNGSVTTDTPPPPVAGNNDVTPPPPPPDNDDPATAAEDAPRLGGIHQPRDLGGRTIMVTSYFDNAIAFTAQDWEEPDPATADNYFIDRLIWDNARRVEQEFNISLDSTNIYIHDLVAALTTSVMAGDAIGDIVFLNGDMILSAVIGDLIMPITGINLPNSDFLGPQIFGRPINDLHNEYWAFVGRGGVSIHNVMMGVNLDIIHAIGAQNPVDLYNQGRWTWDAALEIMRMATRDTTGDGVFDQWGIAAQPGDLINAFIATNDGILVDDNFIYAFDHPNTVEALEFMETIFREGLWQYDPILGINVGDWARNFFAYQEGRAALFISILWGMNDGNLPFEFAVVPFPTGPSNTTGAVQAGGWGGGYTLPFGSSWAPEDLLMIVEEFWAWPGDEPELLLEEGIGWPRSVFLTEEDVQRHLSINTKTTMDVGNTVPQFNWIFGTFANHFANGTMTVMEAIEAYRGPQQELLDLFFPR
ncbi:MAG: extracellular solute-binding protein [Firmicutes bacterium]|nr:extracellular solute-binding protein [Bacillota bacterium]